MDCKCVLHAENPLSFYLSIAAIVISIVAILIDRHGYRSQLRVDFFSEHFKDALNNKIPNARKKLRFDENERLVDYNDLQEALAEIRKNAGYFRYANPVFYWWFKRKDQAAEDYIGKGIEKNHDADRQKKFLTKMDRKLHRLYRTITKEYFG